jgi:hypothetical protein
MRRRMHSSLTCPENWDNLLRQQPNTTIATWEMQGLLQARANMLESRERTAHPCTFRGVCVCLVADYHTLVTVNLIDSEPFN